MHASHRWLWLSVLALAASAATAEAANWVALPRLPVAVNGPAGAIVDGQLRVVGGASTQSLTVTQRWDSAGGNWATAAPLNAPRAFAGAADFGGSLIAIGGLDDFGEGVSSVERFDATSGSWTAGPALPVSTALMRSEEHTSELQSQFHLVCRLLLEKKKKERSEE